MSKALFVVGGWEGHTPRESAALFAGRLAQHGFEVVISDALDCLADANLMAAVALIVPVWTMGVLTPEQERGLLDAVRSGAGVGGWHGTMCDSFRNNPEYQWMTGGQWVAHPGNCIPVYTVRPTDVPHPVTAGIGPFEMHNTEQYYMHTDPSNTVLATTVFDCPDAPTGHGTVMPVVWTRRWGAGRVFYASFGHTVADFEVPEALTIVERGLLWAAGRLS